ncbi:MAG: STAS domain-containing protein [Planctomycetes bacterium]|nr:STAS domain-containing protein [Planctomycetota bacterium]
MELVLEIGKKYPEITGPISDAFAAELIQACDTGEFDKLVLDFKGTKIISSMAMGSIFAIYQRLRDQGKKMEIINASEKVTNLLCMVNMAEILA